MVQKTRNFDTPKLVCEVCGMTEKGVQTTGRLGCPSCYRTFREVLGEILPTMHAGPVHVGQRPPPESATAGTTAVFGAIGVPFPQSLYDVCQVEALRTENYELAAAIRDRVTPGAPGAGAVGARAGR